LHTENVYAATEMSKNSNKSNIGDLE